MPLPAPWRKLGAGVPTGSLADLCPGARRALTLGKLGRLPGSHGTRDLPKPTRDRRRYNGSTRTAFLGWWLFNPGGTWPRGGHVRRSAPKSEVRSTPG